MGRQDGFYKLPARTSAKAAFVYLTVIKMEKKRAENVVSDPSVVLSSFNCGYDPAQGWRGLVAAEAPPLSPAEPPRNPTSIPIPINSKICRTKVLKGYSRLFSLTCQRGCVLHGVKTKFSYFKDVGSDPRIKSILSQLLCSQVCLMTGPFADSLVGSMETSWLVSVASLLVITHSFTLRQCFTGQVKPGQGSCPS